MREITTCPSEKWKQLSTDELDSVLQEELRKEHPDENVVLPILREIESREKDTPVDNSVEISQIRDKLSKHQHISQKRSFRKGWISAIAAAAAVVCIVIMAIPRTVGAESIFDVLVRWTGSVFEFVNPDKDESYPDACDEFTTDNPGLQQLYDKVTELGVTESVVPMWLPDGLVLSELKDSPMPGGVKVFGKFENGECAALFSYRISTDITAKVEKEETGVELFEAGEISHFIVDNDDNLSIKWAVDGVECLLNTNVAKEDLYAILQSIYRSELSE